jgi:hypothetical protein
MDELLGDVVKYMHTHPATKYIDHTFWESLVL